MGIRMLTGRSLRSAAASAMLASILGVPSLRANVPAPATEVTPTVRRWEYVMLVRTSADSVDAIGRAEAAAFQAGGAVLAQARMTTSPTYTDYRMLVRVRDRALLGQVLRGMRLQQGVLGASATPLPETPTEPGGPSFMLSYTAGLGDQPAPPNVVVHHEMPPVLDKADLLEVANVPTGPNLGTVDTAGGVGFNISALIQRLRASAWLKRERRMREAQLNILPEPPATGP